MVKFLIRKIWNRFHLERERLWWYAYKSQFGAVGNNVKIVYPGSFTYNNIFIGSNVYIGEKARLWSSESKIFIGNKVVIGPELVIMGGDHNISKIGTYIIDTKEKKEENDREVHIKNDVWIGCNVIILKGVTINRGAVVGAGSLVTKDIPAYAVVAGNPARVLRYRFSPEEIKKHEDLLSQKE